MPMVAFALLAAAAQTIATPPVAQPPSRVSATSQVMVRIVRAAEVRDGRTSEPHQRRMRRDDEGRPQLLLEFE